MLLSNSNSDTNIKIIKETWKSLIDDINNHIIMCSNERALVFNFTFKLKENLKEKIEIEFEKDIYGEFTGGKFLDLYVKDNKNKLIYGFEFKYPMRSADQKTNRINIIHDIKRLNYLVCKKVIDYGVFLLASDKAPFTYEGNKKNNSDFMTYNGKEYFKGNAMPINLKNSKETIVLINSIKFEWLGCKAKKIEKTIAWIEPIIICNEKK